MSSKGEKPQSPAKPLGTDASRFSTNEQARPVPWFVGRRSAGVTFISDLFDDVRIEQESGGKQSTKTGTDYYASFAFLIGYGPIYRVTQIRLNDDIAWSGTAVFGAAEFIDINLHAPHGAVRIYKGSETQPLDTYLNSWMASKGKRLHPAYRGFAWGRFRRLYLGFNQTNVQTVEITCDRVPEIPWTIYERTFWAAGDPRRISPVAAIADLLQNPRLLNLSDDFLDTADLDSQAQQLATEKIGVNPYFERAQDFRSCANQILEYADASPRITPEGKFTISLNRKPVDVEALPVVDEAMLTGRPDVTIGDWAGIATGLDVSHPLEEKPPLNRHAVTVNSKWRDRGAFRITGEPNYQTASRPFTVDGDIYAAALGRAGALPALSGQCKLIRSGTNFDDLAPGALFVFHYPSRGLNNLVARVQERSESSAGRREFTISWKADRSYLQPASSATAEAVPDEVPEEEVVPISLTARIVELPLGLCPDGKLSVAALLARPSSSHSGFTVNIKESYDWDGAPPASYNLIATASRFAQNGLVEEDFAADVPLIDLEVGLLIRLSAPDSTLNEASAFDAASDDLLVFLEDEILSVHRVELVAEGLYRVYCIRARFATARAAHPAYSVAFLIYRENLLPITHPQFALGNEYSVKLAPITGATPMSLAEVTEITGTIAGRIYAEPALSNLRVNGALSGAGYNTGEDLDLEWTLTDAHADFDQETKIERKIIIELLDAGDVVVDTTELAHVATHTITNADLVTALGGETDCTVRIFRRTIVEMGLVDSAKITLAVTAL